MASDAAGVRILKPPDDVLDVPLAPSAVLARMKASINRREKRLFGIVKTKQEFVGRVFDEGFEVWERQQRAIHLVAFVRAKRGGTRVELRYVLAPVTRVVTVIFFALYVTGTVGLSLRSPDPGLSAVELAAIVLGAALLAAGFAYSAHRQRIDLGAFVAKVFGDEAVGEG